MINDDSRLTDSDSSLDADLNHFNLLYPGIGYSRENQYYDAQKFNQTFTGYNSTELSIIHLNVRSLAANGLDFVTYLETLKLRFKIICLTETWAHDSSLDFLFPDYVGFHNHRHSDRRGGGVSVYVHRTMTAEYCNDLNLMNDSIETVFIKASKADKTIVVGSCYRPPNSSVDTFLANLTEKLHSVNLTQTNFILCGDFNLNLLNIHSNASSADFYDTMYSFHLLPVISKPTRITQDSFSVIDNIFTSNLNNFISGALKTDISDHLLIFIVCNNFYQNQLAADKI